MKTCNHTRIAPRGFALVVTLALMILLTVIAVGLLGLSAVSLRTGSQSSAQAAAQANARLALMIAIGELQRHAGADTRVTASAEIVDEKYPPVLGVWKSWEGTNHAANGRPTAPNYGAKDQPASSGGRFIHWLVSSAANMKTPGIDAPPKLVAMERGSDTIPMLAGGSLPAREPRQVHVVPTRLDGDGRIAWWISGENQKARLAQPYQPRTDSVTGLAEMGQSHTVANPEVFGLPSLLDDPEPHAPDAVAAKPGRKAITRHTMTLLKSDNPVKPQRKFHDFSANAVGLLTNTATGGWRKDLSIVSEKWDSIYSSYPGGRLPLFRITPAAGATTSVPKPVKPAASAIVTNTAALTAATPSQSNLYPWSEYSLILGYTQPGTYHAASASWASLQDFATSYKNFYNDSGVVKSPFVWDRIAKSKADSITCAEIFNHKHKQLLHPQIARFQVIVYARAMERLPVQNPKKYNLRLMYVPFFTLWNPYNISLEHKISGTLNGGQNTGTHTNFLGLGWRRSLPGVMAIVNKATFPNPDSVPDTQFRLLTNGNFQTLDWPNNYANPYDNELTSNVTKYGTKSTWRDLRTWACWLPEGTLTFKPGEAKMFSPEWIDNGYGYGGGAFRLREGYNPTNIVGRDFDALTNLSATQSFWFLYRNDRVTQPFRDRTPGNGFSLSFGDGSSHFGGTAKLPSGLGDEFHNITSLAAENLSKEYWPPDEVDEVGYSLGELASGPWIPIFSTSFGPRMTIGAAPGTEQNRPTKGVLQNDALASMVLSDPGSGVGKDHPANNTFDFTYHSLSIGSTITPNLTESKGFISTGYQSGDGLSRLIMCEVPLRPMASLVELQGWNPRGHNPYPPFQMNLIGNSDATPLIPKDAVVPPVPTPIGVEYNLQHDDAYCANHLLFDDWFVSSIAPLPQSLGGQIAKDINRFYQDFLLGKEQLPNRAYQRIAADSGLNESGTADRAKEVIDSHDGWLKVASRLEVDGMFNVNSTSVAAWEALLGHARSLERIAMHGQNGIVARDTSDGFTVTRGAVATDVEAGADAGFGSNLINASEYTGFRSLSDYQIKDLAEKVVEQVRLRGPFLSLSEFVNRQLSTDGKLALAGAVQSALDALKEDPMAVLRDPKNFLSDQTMDAKDAKLVGVDYQFPEAAVGSSTHGVPGWIRQADILRPIAPVLSARDDTFTIRAYGEHMDPSGRVLARAWCEAVVTRTRGFCDASDSADSPDPPANAANLTFGRRYRITSFRWLNPYEV